MLIDTHCHLDFAEFAEERDAIVARAHEAGVKQMVTISTRVRKLDGAELGGGDSQMSGHGSSSKTV